MIHRLTVIDRRTDDSLEPRSPHTRAVPGGCPLALAELRRSIESDRFGLVARVLAVRDGCTPAACQAFTMLADRGRIAINLSERSYELYVARHATAWPRAPAAVGLCFVGPALMWGGSSEIKEMTCSI